MESPATAPAKAPSSRVCPHCSKVFQGVHNMRASGSHIAYCATAAAAAAASAGPSIKKRKEKEFNCCCRTVCPSMSTLRDHQATCQLFKFRADERMQRSLMKDASSIANEAMHLVFDHGEHGHGDGAAAAANDGSGEHGEGGEEPHDARHLDCDLTHANMHIRIAEAKRQPLTPAMRHELWVAQFCLRRSLSNEDGQELVDKYNEDLHVSEKKNKKFQSQTYRKILENIKFNRRYPDILGYQWDQEVVIDVPAGMNGPDPSQVTFKFADATAVLSSMLQETRLHGNKKENIQWDPKKVLVKGTDERAYDADIFSGDWAFRTKLNIPVGKDLLAVSVYSDATNVTGSGRHLAHPIYIQIGNFVEEVRNKDGAYRPIALLPRLNPIESMKSSEELTAFKLQMFHTCISAALKPLKEMNDKGGWQLNVMGEKRVLLPAISFFPKIAQRCGFITAVLCIFVFHTAPARLFAGLLFSPRDLTFAD